MLKDFKLEENEFVELKSLLKLMNYVNSGGEAKIRIQTGEVFVNGEPETRRGRKLKEGDIVQIDEDKIKILS
ncbi:RNA-binding S4 domain-containing protein [Portibacter marinus]|uniref:RNA-binding S4 domain-containing protein n=1 Tax=Portibacter marinus TaxID=2898660 RepID=UPI001F30D154|nr:RNA-binding S4 domain-containing protein [Portibacter marinus]